MPEASVKILVYGAGVIGTLYAAKLREGGHHVTVVARGPRLTDIRRYGLALEDVVSNGRSTTKVDTTERLGPNDPYDIALIAVRRDQVASVLPELTANHSIPTLIFMLNNPAGPNDLAQALGRERVLLGFPGAGGTRDGHICTLRNDRTTANNVRRIGRATNRAPAQTGRNISAVRISYNDIWRHGCVAKGARLLRHCGQRRDLHVGRRLSSTVRR